jgi:hypothetical protein
MNVVSDLGSVDMYDDGKENKTYAADSKKKPWGKFRLDTFVYTLPETTAIKETTLVPDFSYRINGNVLTIGGIAAGTNVKVVSLDGRVVASAVANAAACSLTLPQGRAVYVVQAGEKSMKLAVR